MKVTIIGAGIGGLTLAIALQKKGLDYEIFESFSEFKIVGAGIKLANNAMQVYEKLGLHEEIRSEGSVVNNIHITDHTFCILSSSNCIQHSDNKVEAVGIHRGALQKILLSKIPGEKIHLNKKLIDIKVQGKETILSFEDGIKQNADLVIGADGIHSKVRQFINKGSILRDAHQDCWRGVLEYQLQKPYANDLNELWGYGVRFGFFQISITQVYWYALSDAVPNKHLPKKEIVNMFKKFHPLVSELMSMTPEEEIKYNKILDLKPIDSWFSGNIVLLGDAAHATTPNMGQGACQTIEDAYLLPNTISRNKNLKNALIEYQNKRIKKAKRIVNTSWGIGKLAHYNNPIIVQLRNILFKSTPEFIIKLQEKRLYKIEV